MFGPHLILDGSQCDTQKLGDRLLIERILTDYPAAIGMTRIGGPYMFEYQAPDPAYSGVSGIVVIAESHIAIHTFPALDYFSMDIFSCKNFDHELAIRYIEDALAVRHLDRMLVQRGLSFRGPHHGADGATDELIAAAQARLAAGVVSNETVTPEEAAIARAQLIARRGPPTVAATTTGSAPAAAPPASGHMIWPRYGVTPDIGTDGAQTHNAGAEMVSSADLAPDGEPCARGGARAIALDGVDGAPTDPAGRPLLPTTPVQVNPTASISGLLDKLGSVGAGGRALSRALGAWERLARDPACSVTLALSLPVIADGLRETLAYAIEQHYVDAVVLTAADVLADLHEALGHYHYLADESPIVVGSDGGHVSALLADFAAEFVAVPTGAKTSADEVLRALGHMLATRAPRKGVLQAASAQGVPVYCPDLAQSAIGQALAAAGAAASAIRIDPLGEVTALARQLGELPRAGMIAVGTGAADALVRQALQLPPAAPDSLAGCVYLEVPARALPASTPAGAIAVGAEASLALPLLVTSLAQRLPDLPARRSLSAAIPMREPPEPALA